MAVNEQQLIIQGHDNRLSHSPHHWPFGACSGWPSLSTLDVTRIPTGIIQRSYDYGPSRNDSHLVLPVIPAGAGLVGYGMGEKEESTPCSVSSVECPMWSVPIHTFLMQCPGPS